MARLTVMLIWMLATHAGWGLSVWAQEFEVGNPIILRATKPVGVPIHRKNPPNFWKHVPTGTRVILEDIASDGQWLMIRLPSGEPAWVSIKYIRASTPRDISEDPEPNTAIHTQSTSTLTSSIEQETKVWQSREGCERVVREGGRMAVASSATLRVATWNLRWFPVGQPQDQHDSQAKPTDIDWLVCTLIWMQLDLLTVQESLGTSTASHAWDTITRILSQKTGKKWKWYRQPCGRPDDHHIGLLWNDSQVELSQFESLWQFNSKAKSPQKACTFGLRPGQYVRVKSRQSNGADFHLISLHLKSGPTVFAVEERQKALNRIDRTIAPFLKQDQDVVILGDFNTMGAGDRHSQISELKYIRRMVSKESPGFDDLKLTPQCSQYFRGEGGWLDHILVTKGMEEVAVKKAQVTGYCGVAQCQAIKGTYPAAYQRLSDHCPVVMEITNQDRDD
ncbi:MAG: endonuclease/exonuclease/phosphatase family protein [Nitrospirales bacterium]|nr:endonuclease/exonuclease/phosphatase family protein [Nitrospira sp.]MDR4500315.1 endonuclease/exonuclease/phosphatase family protein [Nitrospirales bacterium]